MVGCVTYNLFLLLCLFLSLSPSLVLFLLLPLPLPPHRRRVPRLRQTLFCAESVAAIHGRVEVLGSGHGGVDEASFAVVFGSAAVGSFGDAGWFAGVVFGGLVGGVAGSGGWGFGGLSGGLSGRGGFGKGDWLEGGMGKWVVWLVREWDGIGGWRLLRLE